MRAFVYRGRFFHDPWRVFDFVIVGIALMPRHGKDLWHLVDVADQAMYNSKSLDRDDAANDRAAYIEASIAS